LPKTAQTPPPIPIYPPFYRGLESHVNALHYRRFIACAETEMCAELQESNKQPAYCREAAAVLAGIVTIMGQDSLLSLYVLA